MDFVFTQRDLYWLDHLLPDESRRKKEDTKTLELEEKLEQVTSRVFMRSSTGVRMKRCIPSVCLSVRPSVCPSRSYDLLEIEKL